METDPFIAADDFAWLAAHGFNAVRVPVGYWNVIGSYVGGVPYVPVNVHESLKVLDRIFDWSRAHGIGVLVDFHGLPASQNGNDHSGCDSEGIGWRGDNKAAERTFGGWVAITMCDLCFGSWSQVELFA